MYDLGGTTIKDRSGRISTKSLEMPSTGVWNQILNIKIIISDFNGDFILDTVLTRFEPYYHRKTT